MKTLKHKQRGMATMVSAVVLLVVISMMTVYTAQVSVMEQKISSNHYRTQQAFEAAEAGLNNAIYSLDMNIITNAICTGVGIDDTGVCRGSNAGTGIGTEADFSGANALVSLGVSDFTLIFKKNSINDSIIDFTVSGYADDNPVINGNPNRVISQSLMMRPVLSYHPPASLIAKNNITLDSSITISNKFVGSLASSWSGGNTLIVGSPSIDVVSTNGLTTGGYYQNDAVLAALDLGDVNDIPVKPNKFFENYFSESFVNLKNRSEILDCQSGCNESDLSAFVDVAGNPVGNNIIWIDTNDGGFYDALTIDNAINLGTLENPLLLIIDGRFVLNDSAANIIGVIYTTQDVQNTIGGNIVGSIISEQSIVSNGALNVIYNDEVFRNMDLNMAFFSRIAGSWKDF